MADSLKCAKSIRNLAVLFKDMIDAADTLEAIGSVEQANAEGQAALIAARTELEGVRADIRAATDALERASVDKRQLEADAYDNAYKIGEQAQADAFATKRAAEQEAEDILAKAKSLATVVLSELEEKQAQLTVDIADLKQAKADAMEAQAAASRELSSLQTQLSAVKSNLRTLIGD